MSSHERLKSCPHGILPASSCVYCNPQLDPEFRPSPVIKIKAPRPPRKAIRERGPEEEKQLKGSLRLLGKNDEVKNLPEYTTALHIVKAPSAKLLAAVLEVCPGLNYAQFTKSNYYRLVLGNQSLLKLLEREKITHAPGSWRKEYEADLDWRSDPDYEVRKRYLQELKENQRRHLKNAIRLGFEEEWALAERFFCLAQPYPPRISFVELAQNHGMPYTRTRKTIYGMVGWLGCPNLPKGKDISHAIGSFTTRYQRAARLEKSMLERRQYEVYRPLPHNLSPSHYDTFLALSEFEHNSPEMLEGLGCRRQTILEAYYGLADKNRHYTLAEIGKFPQIGLAREAVRYQKNQGLVMLGILEE